MVKGRVAIHKCSIVFARRRQCARPPATRFLAPASLIVPNGSSLQFSHCCMANTIFSLYYIAGCATLFIFPLPQNLPIFIEDLDPHLIHGFWAHPTHRIPPKQHVDRLNQPFFHSTRSFLTDRPTDGPTERDDRSRLVRIGRLSYVCVRRDLNLFCTSLYSM